jgi:hypothetical protein
VHSFYLPSVYPPFTLRLPYIWLHFRSDFGALIYFGLYFIISTYILLSLFVAVIVDNFAACSLNEVQTTLSLSPPSLPSQTRNSFLEEAPPCHTGVMRTNPCVCVCVFSFFFQVLIPDEAITSFKIAWARHTYRSDPPFKYGYECHACTRTFPCRHNALCNPGTWRAMSCGDSWRVSRSRWALR